jgi:hypothetical protein
MILTNREIEELIGETELNLGASLRNPKIKSYLLNYKYDETKLAVGQSLLQETKSFYQKRITEGGSQLVATSLLEKAIEEFKPVYNEHLTLGRLILKHQPEKMARFSISGERRNDFTGYVLQAENFYETVIADEEMLTQYDGLGITKENLENGLAMITAIREANFHQEGAKSAAQAATFDRNHVVSKLADWASDFRVILKLALAPEPQLLEAAGIVAK